jgi:hypothetical protein
MQASTLLDGIAPNCVHSGSNFMKIYNTFSRRTTLDADGTTRLPVYLAGTLPTRGRCPLPLHRVLC